MKRFFAMLLGAVLTVLVGCNTNQPSDTAIHTPTATPEVKAAFSQTPSPSPSPAYKYGMLAEVKGDGITVYYQKEEDAAKDVLAVVQENIGALASKLKLESHAPISLYVFDSREQFHQAAFPGQPQPDWSVGAYISPDVLMTSPANPGPAHSYDSLLLVATHEIVHLLVEEIGSIRNQWMGEGIAVYMAGQVPSPEFAQANLQPPTANDIMLSQHFNERNGYQYSYYFCEYLEAAYGWDAVLDYVSTSSFVDAFGDEPTILHENWLFYLQEQYNITTSPQ